MSWPKLPPELTTVTPFSKGLAIFLFLLLPLGGFLLGMSYQKVLDAPIIHDYLADVQAAETRLMPPPDATNYEEECIGTYLGVPDYAPGDPASPTSLPRIACRKEYRETNLTFMYPCNWQVIPAVAGEKSPTCGRVRELFLLAGERQAGTLTVYPDDTPVTLLANYQKFTDGAIQGVYKDNCREKTINNITGFEGNKLPQRSPYIFISTTTGVMTELEGKETGYIPEFEDIIESLTTDQN